MQWYDDGQVKKNVKFVDGKKTGKEVNWKKDGTIKSEVIYEDGKIIERL
jgi:antitoxin component YwqK of YwqJK toxin-antitoxin module